MKLLQSIRWFFLGTTPNAKRARWVAKITLLLALFIGIFWLIPIDEVINALLHADLPYVLLGFILGLISLVLTSAELTSLVRQQGIQRTVGQILAISLAAKFYSLFAPGTLVAGGIKWYRLAQPGGKTAEAFVALGFFRLLEIFMSITIGLGFWLLSEQNIIQVNMAWLGALIFAIILLWFLLTRLSLPMYTEFELRAERLRERSFWSGVLRQLKRLVLAVSSYAEMPALVLSLTIFLGIVSRLVNILANLFLARALGIQLSYLELGWIYALVYIATQLTFTVAGGLGVREVTLVAVLSTLGIGAEIALAFSFLIFLKNVFLSLVGGLQEAFQTIWQRGLT